MNSLNNSAEALKDRFVEEQKYIQSYVALLERKTSLDAGAVNEVISIVEKYSLGDGVNILGSVDRLSITSRQNFNGRYIRLNENNKHLTTHSSYWYRYDASQLPLINERLQQLIPDIEKAIQDAETVFRTPNKT